MPNPSGTTKQLPAGPATYDVCMISTTTGIVRSILAEGLDSTHSLDTVKAWDATVGTKQAVIADCIHGKHKVGEVFKDYVKGFGYFTADKKHLNKALAPHDDKIVDNKIPAASAGYPAEDMKKHSWSDKGP